MQMPFRCRTLATLRDSEQSRKQNQITFLWKRAQSWTNCFDISLACAQAICRTGDLPFTVNVTAVCVSGEITIERKFPQDNCEYGDMGEDSANRKIGYWVRWDTHSIALASVLAQREMEKRRSPLVSIPPFGRGFSRHRGLSIRCGWAAQERVLTPPFIVSMSPTGYPSAWLRPRSARFCFARQDHCSSGTTCRSSTSVWPVIAPEPGPARPES